MGFKPVRVTKLPSMDGDALRREPPRDPLTDDASELTVVDAALGLGARSRRPGRCGEIGSGEGLLLARQLGKRRRLGRFRRLIHPRLGHLPPLRRRGWWKTRGARRDPCASTAAATRQPPRGEPRGQLGPSVQNATCTTICTDDESSSQGYLSVISSQRMTANEYTSDRSSVGSFQAPLGPSTRGSSQGLRAQVRVVLQTGHAKVGNLGVQCSPRANSRASGRGAPPRGPAVKVAHPPRAVLRHLPAKPTVGRQLDAVLRLAVEQRVKRPEGHELTRCSASEPGSRRRGRARCSGAACPASFESRR